VETRYAPPPPALDRRRVGLRLLGGLGLLIVLGAASAAAGTHLRPDLAVTGIDARATAYLVERRTPTLTGYSLVSSWLADLSTTIVLVGGLAVAAWRRGRNWRLLWLPTLAGAGGLVISAVVKLVSGRERPPLTTGVVDAYGAAFPSGHALRAIVVYGALAWLLSAIVRTRAARLVVWVVAAAVVASVGFSRIYLGVHWLTDVMVGYILGLGWLAMLVVMASRSTGGRPGAHGTSG
jgi:membrane-associated phospholipid phosphatase